MGKCKSGNKRLLQSSPKSRLYILPSFPSTSLCCHPMADAISAELIQIVASSSSSSLPSSFVFSFQRIFQRGRGRRAPFKSHFQDSLHLFPPAPFARFPQYFPLLPSPDSSREREAFIITVLLFPSRTLLLLRQP